MRILRCLCVLAVLILTTAAAFAQQYKVIYDFGSGGSSDAYGPYGSIAFDSSGNLYGTAEGGGAAQRGAIFQLSPAGDSWRERVLYSFCLGGEPCSDGTSPFSGVILDTSGNLYGSTYQGGGTCPDTCGLVFELSHPSAPSGAWTETVLWQFSGGEDGCSPDGPLVMDGLGNLYGTAEACGPYGNGTVFELSPPPVPGGAWTESTLYGFCSGGSDPFCKDGSGPIEGVIFDRDGNLYGETKAGGKSNNAGVVYQLSPPTGTGAWKQTAIAQANLNDGFPAMGGLTFDEAGNLFGALAIGANDDQGAMFRLRPGLNGKWSQSEVVLTDGVYPLGRVLFDDGTLYGVTQFGGGPNLGTLFKIHGPSETVLYNFCSQRQCADGSIPSGPPARHDGKIYGLTVQGGAPGGYGGGVVYEVTP